MATQTVEKLSPEQMAAAEKRYNAVVKMCNDFWNGIPQVPGEAFTSGETGRLNQEVFNTFLQKNGATWQNLTVEMLDLCYHSLVHKRGLKLIAAPAPAPAPVVKSHAEIEAEKIVEAERSRKELAELRQRDEDAIRAREQRAYRESYRGGVSADVLAEQRSKSEKRSSFYDGIQNLQNKIAKLHAPEPSTNDHKSAAEIAFEERQRREQEQSGYAPSRSGCPLTANDIRSADAARVRLWASEYGWEVLNRILNS